MRRNKQRASKQTFLFWFFALIDVEWVTSPLSMCVMGLEPIRYWRIMRCDTLFQFVLHCAFSFFGSLGCLL